MSLFFNLQLALLKNVGRITITTAVHDELDNWQRLITSVATWPTHMLEIIPPDATMECSHGASSSGMGGVFCKADRVPVVWRMPFPLDIRECLVGFDNPDGDRDINEFELAGHLSQITLISARSEPHTVSSNGCNNFAAAS